MLETNELQNISINAIRFLSADAVQNAKSGHPGLPMGAAPIAYTLWTRHLRHNPSNPAWANRDRFILSGGHGSMLLYSMLYLTGYDLPLEEIKRFRQWGSKTPGHPEFGMTPGVETTTGPLGQGFANGVGMAIAEAHLAAVYNRPGHEIINHYTYAIVTDGDLMEGVSNEAASLAGHLQLGKLIYLYDDNQISIEGSTSLAFTEDREKRFEALGWQVLKVADGLDVEAIDAAIRQAKLDPRPSLIMVRTIIGYGLPTRAGTAKAHGEAPGDAELDGAKEKLGWPKEPRFYVPETALAYFRQAVECGAEWEYGWNEQFKAYQAEFPELAAELRRRLSGELPQGWDAGLPVFPADEKGMATRSASGKVLAALAKAVPELAGGSADLAPSNNTWLDGIEAFGPGEQAGRNFHFGVREHGMGSALNGMAYHGGMIPYGGTFMVFADYMRPAIRLSALSHLRVIWVLTHDSVAVGEDGPTHQPVEHLASLRVIPNLQVIRPCDANETREAWKAAVSNAHGPTVLGLTRQNLPVLDRSVYAGAENLHRGAYVLADLGQGEPRVILMSSGSEVALIVAAGRRLAEEGVTVRLVSVPWMERFAAQDEAYRDSVLLPGVERRLAVEAGVRASWDRWVGLKGDVISLERFGASAPGNVVFENLGFTVENVVARAKALLARG